MANRAASSPDLSDTFHCSYPDWASMCKHVASVLYGVGSRLDDRPESLFLLRGVDTAELIATEMTLPGDAGTDDALADDALAGLFGIDLDTGVATDNDAGDAAPPSTKASAKRRKQASRLAAPAPERQAPSAARARELPVSTMAAGRPRKTTSGAAPGKKASPAAAPRKQAATRAGDLTASTTAAGRPRKTTSGAAPGEKASGAAGPRRQTAAEAAAPPRDIRPTGEWVARLRRRSGFSVTRFAEQLGVSAVTVYRWEATSGPLNALMAFYRRFRKPGRRR